LKDCQRLVSTPFFLGVIMITGTDDHDPPETMITIHWIE